MFKQLVGLQEICTSRLAETTMPSCVCTLLLYDVLHRIERSIIPRICAGTCIKLHQEMSLQETCANFVYWFFYKVRERVSAALVSRDFATSIKKTFYTLQDDSN